MHNPNRRAIKSDNVTSVTSSALKKMNLTPTQSNYSPLVTPDGIIKTDKLFFPTGSLSDVVIDGVKTKPVISKPYELHPRPLTDEITQVLGTKSISTVMEYRDLQDYGCEWYSDRMRSVQLTSSTSSDLTGQEHEFTSLSPCAAKPIINPPRFQDWLSYSKADAAESTPSDESPPTVSYSCSDYSLDSAFESICNEFKPFDYREETGPVSGCLNMLLECRNVSNEQPNIQHQDGEISEWPTTESVLCNAYTPDLDQHTHLQDGGCHNKIGRFAVSENKSKYSNIEQWINSDVQHSAPQRCEDVRANASPQSTLSTYSDPSLFDRELSAEVSRRVKNNAASQRSRACRKQRFQLMQMRVKELDTVNNGLRETLKGLDRLLAEAKEILLQQATKSQDWNQPGQSDIFLP